MTKIVIEQDSEGISPREWDNLGVMVAFHRRYSLGDKGHEFRSEDYTGWDEMERAIARKYRGAIILPLYLYDHSGITMNTTGFSYPWDSGQVGFIFATPKRIREAFNVKRITARLRAKVEALLIAEVSTFDQYLQGDVYQFHIIGGEHDGLSVGGFYGTDPFTNGMSDHIPVELHELLRESST